MDTLDLGESKTVESQVADTHPAAPGDGDTPKVRTIQTIPWIDVLSLLISVAALVLSGFAFYASYFDKHDLTATVSMVRMRDDQEAFQVDIVFKNAGNRSETVLVTRLHTPYPFAIPFGSGELAVKPVVSLSPIVLDPGEIAVRRLVQPTDYERISQLHLSAPNYDSSKAPYFQLVSIEFIALGTMNVPVTTTAPLTRFLLGGETLSTAYGVDSTGACFKNFNGFTQVHLLKSADSASPWGNTGPILEVIDGLIEPNY